MDQLYGRSQVLNPLPLPQDSSFPRGGRGGYGQGHHSTAGGLIYQQGEGNGKAPIKTGIQVSTNKVHHHVSQVMFCDEPAAADKTTQKPAAMSDIHNRIMQ